MAMVMGGVFKAMVALSLPDGTKISIKEKGEGKDLHINQVDIYNGNKHVQVKIAEECSV